MSTVQKIFLLFVSLLLFNLLLVTIFSDKGFVELIQLKNDEKSLIEQNTALVQKNFALHYEIDRLKNDPGFIENVARQKLGMIGKDEVILNLNRTKTKRPKNE